MIVSGFIVQNGYLSWTGVALVVIDLIIIKYSKSEQDIDYI
jgi:hypothetical protein